MISIIVPMFNEQDNVEGTAEKIRLVMDDFEGDWELLLVDDGSADDTGRLIDEVSDRYPNVRAFHHDSNLGVGRALRTGFEEAEGEIIVTVDADLSYDPKDIPRLVSTMRERNADVVLSSPYHAEGRTSDVPFYRLLISQLGNTILRLALGTDVSCVTSIFRAYRKSMIDRLELSSDGKSIEPEIVARALAMGFHIEEIPATLKGRVKGKSKFRFRREVFTHLMFCFETRPMLVFAFLGTGFLGIASLIGLYLMYLLYALRIGIMRPLLFLGGGLFIIGIQTLAFCFLADQITILRKEIARLRRG